jgi:hypothetical protein
MIHIGRDGSNNFFAQQQLQQLFFRIGSSLPDTLIGLDPITKRWFYRTTGYQGLSSEARLR